MSVKPLFSVIFLQQQYNIDNPKNNHLNSYLDA